MRSISVLLVFVLLSSFGIAQDFLAFQTKESRWAIEWNEFKATPQKFLVKDSSLLQIKMDPVLDIFTIVYYDDDNHIGMMVDTKTIDSLGIIVEGISIDPLVDSIGKYDGKTYLLDITESIRKHIFATYQGRGRTPEEIQDKVKKIASKYIKMGGEVVVRLWKSNDRQPLLFRVIPEKYGFSFYNEALPINGQYSTSSTGNSDLKNLVNIYYPFQYVIEAKDRKGFNVTSITKRLSFGPYLLATLGNNLSMKGGGFLLGFALSGKGLPVVGIGIGFSSISPPFVVYTLNPIEIGRILFHPAEIWTD